MAPKAMIAVLLTLAICVVSGAGTEVSISIDPGRVLGHVDEKVYGHFLEHIYHSVNGGLWGEMVWSRSFEDDPGGGNWSVEDDAVVQRGRAQNVRLLFGDRDWTDYEYTLEAQKIDGDEGFLIMFRETSVADFYWYNLGGWRNTRHALERGVSGEGRWRPIEPGTPGRIDTGRWYRIRVRVEGPRIQVYLDDARLLDFTDTTHPHLAGRVGIGTWQTSVRFRKLKVTSLDGKILHEGLPEDLPVPRVAKGWTSYGEGEFLWTREAPLNSEYCQMLASTGKEAGVSQTPFNIEQGQGYQGSVWVRGEAPKGLVVRLLAGDQSLAEVSLDQPGGEWREFPFTLNPSASAANATLQIGVKGEGKVWIDQVSLMSDAARKIGGYRPDLFQAMADLRPPIIRWPGGSFAEHYRWKDGIGPQHRRVKYPRVIWDDQDVNSFGTDEFIAMCRAMGVEPMIVINIGRHMPREQRPAMIREAQDWLEYCNGPATSKWGQVRAANGHPEPYNVKYWEIDNETWDMGAANYAAAVREFVPALKKIDPTLRILACGSNRFNLAWNRTVIEGAARFIDYLSIHHYENPNNFADGPRRYEQFFQQTADLIARSANPGMKLFVSEWNAQSTDWRTGLYAGGLLNAFERTGAVEIASPALFLRHVSARAWDNAFINLDHRTWFPAPNYVVMKLYRQHYAPDRLAITGGLGGLNAVATKSADGKHLYLKAVNPTNNPVAVQLEIKGDFEAEKVSLQLVAPDSLSARNTLGNPRAVQAFPGKIRREGRTVSFSLPRWSVGVVSLE